MSASVETLEFHTTQRCHSVFSCFAPLASFHDRLVARENVATRLPPDVDRTSGSLPRFPINVTLFKLRLTFPPEDVRPSVFENGLSRVTKSLHHWNFQCTRLSYCLSVRRRISASSTGLRY